MIRSRSLHDHSGSQRGRVPRCFEQSWFWQWLPVLRWLDSAALLCALRILLRSNHSQPPLRLPLWLQVPQRSFWKPKYPPITLKFSDAQTRNIYTLAAKVKPVLYQEPCYCGCDKEVGHKSLLDCFTDYHGAHCILCKKEAAFTYSESQQGKSAAEIRKEIMDGKWKEVNLAAYDSLPAAK
jgi:hypothetical protein